MNNISNDKTSVISSIIWVLNDIIKKEKIKEEALKIMKINFEERNWYFKIFKNNLRLY